MLTTQNDVRTMIAVRVVVVTTLLLAIMIVQFTVFQNPRALFKEMPLLPISYLYSIATLTYGLTLFYIVAARFISSREVNLSLQITGDLLIETLLVYFTGGPDSPFSFLYLVSIITASVLLYRRGGLLTASGCVILYAGLGDLLFYGVLVPPPSAVFSFTTFSSVHLYVNMVTNFTGFYATAFLTSLVSEKLRQTYRELDVNRQNLAELQALNRNLVESIPSGLVTLTEEGIITFVNPAASDILRIPVDALIGRPLTRAGLFSEKEWKDLRTTLQTRLVSRGEKVDFNRGDEIVSIGYALTPLRTVEGSRAGITLIFQDLTEVKKLEEQLRLKDRMAAVGELSAGIAHEIRNPLAAIAGSVQVLRNSEHLSPQEQRLMSIILKESERLNKSIADFLHFVKPQERRAIDFDIAGNLAETLELLANSAELKGHKIEKRIEPPNLTIVGDADQIRQVFWNVARNAIQAMPEGGVLHVVTSVDADFFRIAFTDNGQGMTPNAQRLLFQPYRTSFPAGTGLGMAISYRIIQEHGGVIGVESQAGVGTTITLSLPRRSTVAAHVRQADLIASAP
ncbi:MAG TPA: ATP-binding protein [Thermoanaerobaculia bacterium]|nr:ATP-binding protein [Thermoanaerobaculia bacterium]